MTTHFPGPKRPHPIQPPQPGPEHGADGWATIAEHREAVVTFLERRCRDVHQAEDLAHDTLLRASRYAAAMARVLRPRSWLVQIAANVQRDAARQEARMQLRPFTDPVFHNVSGTEPIPGDSGSATSYTIHGRAVDRDELVDCVHEVWGGLLERDRTVLEAYYRDGGSTGGAAEAVSVEPTLVKVRLFRARRRLESELRRRVASL